MMIKRVALEVNCSPDRRLTIGLLLETAGNMRWHIKCNIYALVLSRLVLRSEILLSIYYTTTLLFSCNYREVAREIITHFLLAIKFFDIIIYCHS